jgi:hypothetical protein
MAANSSLNLSSLDFDTLKDNLKTFMKSQSVLKDYNYEGSNMNVLLDVLSYNSYLNSFYLNMVASEMFLDSAQKLDSVISHSKELNYVPLSYSGAVSNVNITFETTGISTTTGILSIPKGTRFFGTNSNGTYQFVTTDTQSYASTNDTFFVSNLQIREGSYNNESFLVNYDIENQRFILSDPKIDTDTLNVFVVENFGYSNTLFSRKTTLFGLDSTSNVYFLQATQNGQYEIIFGDNNFGRKPLNSSTVLVDYVVTSGSDGNGISELNISDDIGPINGGSVLSATVSVTANSSGGANQESIDSIRFNAPRYFATQQRAVSSDDYASLIKANFQGEISDVAVFGGETLPEKKYGRVIVCLKPSAGVIAPNYVKDTIIRYLQDYIVLPNRVETADPDYLYVYLTSTVQYDPYATNKTILEVKNVVLTTINTYNNDHLELFGEDLRYSRLVAHIDDSDSSIVSNQTDFRIIKRMSPLINRSYTETLYFNNIIYLETQPVTSIGHIEFYGSNYNVHFNHASVISSLFTYNHTDGMAYPFSYFEDDSHGKIDVYALVGNQVTKLDTIGTVDYIGGIVKLNNISISAYDNYISVYAKTKDRDIFAGPKNIIVIDPNDVTVTIEEKRN